jgi:hypothetical protein
VKRDVAVAKIIPIAVSQGDHVGRIDPS